MRYIVYRQNGSKLAETRHLMDARLIAKAWHRAYITNMAGDRIEF